MAPSRVLPLVPREVKEDLTLETMLVKIKNQSEKTLRNKRVSLIRVVWRNTQIEEEMWERESKIKEKYPHLFLESGVQFNSRTNFLLGGKNVKLRIKYTKKGKFIIIQNVVIIQNLCKKREKDGAKMELRRDETINNHPFSYPWLDDNKKEGGEF